MKSNAHYRIRSDFRPRQIANTRSENNPDYWNEERIAFSSLYSYATYKTVSHIIRENPSIKRMIDLGCGPGKKLASLVHPLGVDITGVDQERPVQLCKQLHNFGHFIVDDLEKGIPSHDVTGKFDLVMSAGVIEHLLDPDKIIEYIRAISHKNTWVVIATADRDIIQGRESLETSNIEHVWEWTIREFVAYLQSHDLKVVEQRLDDGFKASPKIQKSMSMYQDFTQRRAQRHLVTVVAKWNTELHP